MEQESLENAIIREKIMSYDYNEFSAPKQIGEGGFGTVYESEWKDYKLTVALKKLIKPFDEKIIVKELKNLQKVCKHPNIIEFYGVTRDPSEGIYNIVLQFANNGDLRKYLKVNFSKLEWTDKFRIAYEISEGLAFLHKNNVIHLDLHSKNILVHNEKMLIADFGLSRDETSRTSGSTSHGMVGYVDPKCFGDNPYVCSKKSDIYSLGVILWEISSGRPPFQSFRNVNQNIALCIRIRQGERENPIEGTPDKYIEIYRRCWDYDPEQRPESKYISKKLKDLWKEEIIKFIINNLIMVIYQICWCYNLNQRQSLEEISKKLGVLQDLSKQEKRTYAFIPDIFKYKSSLSFNKLIQGPIIHAAESAVTYLLLKYWYCLKLEFVPQLIVNTSSQLMQYNIIPPII